MGPTPWEDEENDYSTDINALKPKNVMEIY